MPRIVSGVAFTTRGCGGRAMSDSATHNSHLPRSVKHSHFHFGLTVLLGIAILLALMPAALAQENATITGTVMDPSGAAVANATIKITNMATGQIRQVTSN